MDMDDGFPRLRQIKHLVPASGDVAEAGAKYQKAVRRPESLGELRVHAGRQVPGVVRMPVVEIILPPEAGGDREREPLCEFGKQRGGALRPAGAADHDERP